jgi:hypothetical protein
VTILDPMTDAGREIRLLSLDIICFNLHLLTQLIELSSTSCAGMLGTTIGAGEGRYQGLHGFLIDAPSFTRRQG